MPNVFYTATGARVRDHDNLLNTEVHALQMYIKADTNRYKNLKFRAGFFPGGLRLPHTGNPGANTLWVKAVNTPHNGTRLNKAGEWQFCTSGFTEPIEPPSTTIWLRTAAKKSHIDPPAVRTLPAVPEAPLEDHTRHAPLGSTDRFVLVQPLASMPKFPTGLTPTPSLEVRQQNWIPTLGIPSGVVVDKWKSYILLCLRSVRQRVHSLGCIYLAARIGVDTDGLNALTPPDPQPWASGSSDGDAFIRVAAAWSAATIRDIDTIIIQFARSETKKLSFSGDFELNGEKYRMRDFELIHRPDSGTERRLPVCVGDDSWFVSLQGSVYKIARSKAKKFTVKSLAVSSDARSSPYKAGAWHTEDRK